MKNIKLIILIILAVIAHTAFADPIIVKQNLQRAINELEAAKVYIENAKQTSDANQRAVFHYQWVMDDINKIEGGIEERFQQTRIQPRVLPNIKGDYLAVVGDK